jgi:aryl-alcohol dehydrogenase-like predicted oxidoreductase
VKTRALGPSGIRASAVAFGAWAIGGWRWGGSDEKTSLDALRAGLDAGITFIDTAPAYGLGRGEELVGKAIEGRRDRVVIATKCGLSWSTSKGTLFFVSDEKGKNEAGAYRIHKYLGPESVRAELETSLRKLRTDYIDLYLTHWQDVTTPIEDTMALLLDFKRQGKIRAIGACNATVADLGRYRSKGPVDANQERFSILDRQQEGANLPWVRDQGAAFLAYSPLHHGLLTGKAAAHRAYPEGDLRKGHPSFTPENVQRVNGLLDRLRPIAERHRATRSRACRTPSWGPARPSRRSRTPGRARSSCRRRRSRRSTGPSGADSPSSGGPPRLIGA